MFRRQSIKTTVKHEFTKSVGGRRQTIPEGRHCLEEYALKTTRAGQSRDHFLLNTRNFKKIWNF
jgi:hypothetical protein